MSSRVRVLKMLLLMGITVTLVGVAAVYILNRLANFQPTFTAPVSNAERAGATQVGRGVDHTITHGGKPMFRVRGDRDRQDRDGTIHVENVTITVYREDGNQFQVSARQASYHPERQEAILEQDVELSGPRGLTLETQRLELVNQGQVMRSTGEVTFHSEGEVPFDGRAGSFRGLVKRGQFLLENGVEVESRPEAETAFSLAARRAIYSRENRIVRLEQKAVVTWSSSRVVAHRIAVHLDDERDRIRLVQARWQVRLFHQGSPADSFERFSASTDHLTLEMEADGSRPRRLQIEGQGGSKPRCRLLLRTGETYNLAAKLMNVEFDQGNVRSIAAAGTTEISQGFATTELSWRRLCAERATVHFDDQGRMAEFGLAEQVNLHQPGWQLSATEVSGGLDRLEAYGDPVVLISDQGTMQAPTMTYSQASTVAHFRDGVRTTITAERGGPFGGTPLTEEDEPLRVTSDEGFWTQAPQSFLFKGTVRAWSGESVLRSEQLRGDPDSRTITAADEVETVWFTESRDGQPRRRIEVRADQLVFDDADQALTYEGDVSMVDEGRSLSCDRITVLLDENGQAEHVTGVGAVELISSSDGRTVRADRAEYDLRRDRAVFYGEPVELEDRQGGHVTGRMLTYALESEMVRMFSDPVPLEELDEPSEDP